jgi:hypothetical protein
VPLRRIALLTLFAFGCATVRVPVSALSEPADAAGVIAPPITELWIESSEEVPAELSAKMDGQARAALDEALASREIRADAAGATDAVLFVRERAVATTEARQSQQTWAKVGIVVGIVVVVVAVVVIAVSGGKGSSSHSASGKSAPAVTKAPASVPVRPRALPVAPPRVSPPRVTPPRVAPARVIPYGPMPYVYRPVSPFFMGFYFDFWIPPQPAVLAPDPAVEEPWYAPEPPVPLASDAPPPFDDTTLFSEPPPPEPDPIAAVALQLPPLADVVTFKVEDRGFFAGPQAAVQFDLLDRATGRLLWSKAVNADADPLDPKAMSKVLDEAFAGVSWARPIRPSAGQ